MSKPIWMPLNPGDYLKDTMHLDTAEHGAYLFLLMQAWVRGGSLPVDHEQLRRMTRMTPEQWASSSSTLLAFFTDAGDCLRHKRVDADLAKAEAFRAEQARKSKLGVEARMSRRSPDDQPAGHPDNNPRVTQTQSQSQSHTTSQDKPQINTPPLTVSAEPNRQVVTLRPAKVSLDLDLFENFWNAYPRRIGKGQARKAWASAIAKAPAADIAQAAAAFAARSAGSDPKYIPHPSTWLNGERWSDQPDPMTKREAALAVLDRIAGDHHE